MVGIAGGATCHPERASPFAACREALSTGASVTPQHDLEEESFLEENRPVLFLGQPGCGKMHLAVALATAAVKAGYPG